MVSKKKAKPAKIKEPEPGPPKEPKSKQKAESEGEKLQRITSRDSTDSENALKGNKKRKRDDQSPEVPKANLSPKDQMSKSKSPEYSGYSQPYASPEHSEGLSPISDEDDGEDIRRVRRSSCSDITSDESFDDNEVDQVVKPDTSNKTEPEKQLTTPNEPRKIMVN